MSNEMYKQCELRDGSGRVDTAWIPTKHARQGKLLRIGDDPVSWKVTAVFDGVCSEEGLLAARENLKRFKWVLGK